MASRPGQSHFAQQIVEVTHTQLDLELLRKLQGQLPSRQRLILSLARIQPLAQRRMGLLRMTIPTIEQSFPTPSASLIPSLKLGQVFLVEVQRQLRAYLIERLTRLNAVQKTFQALGFLTHRRGMRHHYLLEKNWKERNEETDLPI